MKHTTKRLGELVVGDNIYRDSHIYMVTAVIFHEDDDNLVTVKLGYPRRIEPDYDVITEITSSPMRPITVYVR